MKTKTFNGKTENDLAQQFMGWQQSTPGIRIREKHPIEALPLTLTTPIRGAKVQVPDRVTMRVDYDDD
jgi:hypothetical protein